MLYSNINVISHHSLHKKLLEELDGQGNLNKIMYYPKRRACRRNFYAGCKSTHWRDHSPPQKAFERTGKSGPTVQHLHRQPLPICTLSRCGTLYEWLFSLLFLYTHYIYQSRLSFFSKLLLFMYSPKIVLFLLYLCTHVLLSSLFYCCIILLNKKVLEELYGQGRLCNTSITSNHQCERYLVVGL